MLAGRGLEALDLERRRTRGKLRACDRQQRSWIAKIWNLSLPAEGCSIAANRARESYRVIS